MKVVGPRPGFPAVLQASNTDSTSGEGSSSQVHGNVHVEQNRPMDRYEAERLEKRKKGFCYWFGRSVVVVTGVSSSMVFRWMNRGQGLQGRPQGMVQGEVLVQMVEKRRSLLNSSMMARRILWFMTMIPK